MDIKKSKFNITKIKFLGFIIRTNGIAINANKLAIIKDWEPPTSIKGVQFFLEFYNFYQAFLKDYD